MVFARNVSFIAMFLIAALVALPEAEACTVAPGYRPASTEELVDSADAIVLARVTDGGLSIEAGLRQAALTPISLLKGASLPTVIQSRDLFLTTGSLHTAPSAPANVTDPHPDVFAGACSRYLFDMGMLLVVFLKRKGDAFTVYAPPFSRALEDVPSTEALWVSTVKQYVATTPKTAGSISVAH